MASETACPTITGCVGTGSFQSVVISLPAAQADEARLQRHVGF